mmetsp:Transcript_14662/g.20431  ORF Transcript_14662/g.20431 Transcript_14662/m.20431 type:complete len:550 (-) Transcript_14662:27-1676(-)
MRGHHHGRNTSSSRFQIKRNHFIIAVLGLIVVTALYFNQQFLELRNERLQQQTPTQSLYDRLTNYRTSGETPSNPPREPVDDSISRAHSQTASSQTHTNNNNNTPSRSQNQQDIELIRAKILDGGDTYLRKIRGELGINDEVAIAGTNSCGGKFTTKRDYNQDPVVHIGLTVGERTPCDIRCVRHGSSPIDVGGHDNCIHTKTYDFTMENTGRCCGNYRAISGNTKLTSDVPMQYFNWEEYDFMRKPIEKTATGHVAAFISNCGPQFRLNYMAELQKYGVIVHSYGACSRNMPEPPLGHRHNIKLVLGGTYKFLMAFENSETEDYVTEKILEPLEGGSVPLYHGSPVPFCYKFAPNNHSVVFADDFKSPEELAKYILYLDKNDTAYNEYLTWKETGPSKDWIAHIDLGIIHSECRTCIRSADIDRVLVGEVETGPYVDLNQEEMNKYKGKDALMIRIRKRSTFYFKRIHLESLTAAELFDKIYEKYDPEMGAIFKIFDVWDRKKTPIQTDEQVRELSYGQELEVIFEEPRSKERGRFSKWVYEKNGWEW